MGTTNKMYVIRLKLHENQNEFFSYFTGDFEMIEKIIKRELEQKTNIRFRNIADYESRIKTKDSAGYHSNDVVVTGWLHKLFTPEFNRVDRCQNGRGSEFKQDIDEYIGNSCYIPTCGNCFTNCVNHLTGKDYSEDILN